MALHFKKSMPTADPHLLSTFLEFCHALPLSVVEPEPVKKLRLRAVAVWQRS